MNMKNATRFLWFLLFAYSNGVYCMKLRDIKITRKNDTHVVVNSQCNRVIKYTPNSITHNTIQLYTLENNEVADKPQNKDSLGIDDDDAIINYSIINAEFGEHDAIYVTSAKRNQLKIERWDDAARTILFDKEIPSNNLFVCYNCSLSPDKKRASVFTEHKLSIIDLDKGEIINSYDIQHIKQVIWDQVNNNCAKNNADIQLCILHNNAKDLKIVNVQNKAIQTVEIGEGGTVLAHSAHIMVARSNGNLIKIYSVRNNTYKEEYSFAWGAECKVHIDWDEKHIVFDSGAHGLCIYDDIPLHHLTEQPAPHPITLESHNNSTSDTNNTTNTTANTSITESKKKPTQHTLSTKITRAAMICMGLIGLGYLLYTFYHNA